VSALALRDGTQALRVRLEQALGAGEVFVGSPADKGAETARLSLFLLRVVVNADLRNAGRRLPPADPAPPPAVRERALPLDAYYLLTAGPSETAAEPIGLEALGRAIQALEAAPLLASPAVVDQLVRLSLEPMSEEALSRIWALFPTIPYRTSVVYLATPVWIDPAAVGAEAPRVVEDERRYWAGVNQGQYQDPGDAGRAA
jgi:hypothetical protein